MPHRPALVLVAALALLPFRPEPSPAQSGWELNFHGATLVDDLFPESGGSILAGARLVFTTPWRLTVGGNFDWARTREVVLAGSGDVTADLLLASGELGYAAPLSPRTDLMLAAGAGTASVRLDGVPPGAPLLERSSGLLVPVGVGIRFRNRPAGASWAFRADVRDQVIFLDVVDPTSGEVDPEPRHNWELSAGLSVMFGGGPGPVQPAVAERPPTPEPGPRAAEPRERPETEDADRDGVPDRLDRCPRTPSQLAVGPTGCPIDMDRDGDPDLRAGVAAAPAPVEPDVRRETPPRPRPDAADVDRDVAPERPAADREEAPARADADREAVPERPAAGREEPPAGADTDGDGVPDTVDRCVNTPGGVRVDERGCPVAAVQPPEPATGACLDARPWNRPGVTIAFDGRLWEQLGQPEPVTADNLRRVGVFDGVPIFVATVAQPPFRDIWVPRCDPVGTYQAYVEEGIE